MAELDDFCMEQGCVNYAHIEKLKSQPDEAKLRNLRIYCERICPRTAYEFDKWIKRKTKNDRQNSPI